MIPILCKVHDSSGRLSRGTHVSLRYGGVAWNALTSPRGVIETWYFDKVVAEDMHLKCSITIKQEESYGHDLITYFFQHPGQKYIWSFFVSDQTVVLPVFDLSLSHLVAPMHYCFGRHCAPKAQVLS